MKNGAGLAHDELTQGTGATNAAGAISLAAAINTAAPVGTSWLMGGVNYVDHVGRSQHVYVGLALLVGYRDQQQRRLGDADVLVTAGGK
jgi:hypothetical protein